jgi:hypothetical protein
VPQGKTRNQPGHFPPTTGQQNKAEQKRQVVGTGQDMLRANPQVLLEGLSATQRPLSGNIGHRQRLATPVTGQQELLNLPLHSSTSCMAQASLSSGSRSHLLYAVVRFAAMFKFAPDEFVEPSTIGLKVRHSARHFRTT